MREEEFRNWLKIAREYTTGGAESTLTRCKRVERVEGDLDKHFMDGRIGLLIQKFSYSTEDDRAGRPNPSTIAIKGDIRTGLSVLRTALHRYQEFRSDTNWGEMIPFQENPTVPSSSIRKKLSIQKTARQEWPEWEQPDSLKLAEMTVPFVRFLNPEIVRMIVEDNEVNRENWREMLEQRNINASMYLWERCATAFPGIRRHIGQQESHRFHKNTNPQNAFRLDDNHYPKQIWSYIFRGKPFANFGPKDYELCHLASHKDTVSSFSGSHFRLDLNKLAIHGVVPETILFGLFTSVANAVYIPRVLKQASDYAPPFINLMMRKAYDLYGNICNLLPPEISILTPESSEWSLERFNWAEPVGNTNGMADFLTFRKNIIQELATTSLTLDQLTLTEG